MRLKFLVLFCGLYSFSAFATSGNELLVDCTADQESVEGKLQYLICDAYIQGARDMHGFFWILDLDANMDENAINYDAMTVSAICSPDGYTKAQAIDIVIAFLRANPEQRHTDAAKFVYGTLVNAWPCDFEAQHK